MRAHRGRRSGLTCPDSMTARIPPTDVSCSRRGSFGRDLPYERNYSCAIVCRTARGRGFTRSCWTGSRKPSNSASLKCRPHFSEGILLCRNGAFLHRGRAPRVPYVPKRGRACSVEKLQTPAAIARSFAIGSRAKLRTTFHSSPAPRTSIASRPALSYSEFSCLRHDDIW
jgi:hypothetical protein